MLIISVSVTVITTFSVSVIDVLLIYFRLHIEINDYNTIVYKEILGYVQVDVQVLSILTELYVFTSGSIHNVL